ncbi:MAG: metal ABC transporter permease [Planctomycetota bacterium]
MTAAPVSTWWQLFGDAVTTAVLLGAILPLLGLLLALRRQVFLTAAVGQAANLGMAVALWAGVETGHAASAAAHATLLAAGLVAAAATAAAALRALSTGGGAFEARAAWGFLAGGALTMLLLADAPHGLQEVQRLFLSSVLGASPTDVGIAIGLAVGVGLAVWRARRQLLLWAIDPSIAAAYGVRVRRWDLGIGAFVGVTIGFAIHATGLTMTFGLCALPVLLAREVCRVVATALWLAPLAGAAAAAGGFAAGEGFDLPPGQCAVALLAVAVAVAGLARRVRRVRPPR